MQTRSKQISFRFLTYVFNFVIMLLFLGNDFFVLRYSRRFQLGTWPVPLLLFRPMITVVAWVDLLIAFLPPETKDTWLGFILNDMNNELKVPWSDVCLASAASFDAYFDSKACETTSKSGSGTIAWTRPGYRILEWIRNDKTHAHGFVAEIVPHPAQHRLSSMRTGDLVVAFRGTGSITNALTDIRMWRTSLPPELVQPRFQLRTNTDTQRNGDNQEPSFAPVQSQMKPQTSRDSIVPLILPGNTSRRQSVARIVAMENGLPESKDSTVHRISETVHSLDYCKDSNHDDEDRRQHDHGDHHQQQAQNQHSHYRHQPDQRKTDTKQRGAQNDPLETFHDQEENTHDGASPRPPQHRKQIHHHWKAIETNDNALESVFHWIANGKVHSGFLLHYYSIRDQLLAKIDPLLMPEDPKPSQRQAHELKDPEAKVPARRKGCCGKPITRKRRILVTGHSLGGALATLASLDLATRYHGEYDVSMISVAAPRVGNRMFANRFNESVPNAVRLVHDRDPIPETPKILCFYKHVGHEVLPTVLDGR